jgi:hypothetical protein
MPPYSDTPFGVEPFFSLTCAANILEQKITILGTLVPKQHVRDKLFVGWIRFNLPARQKEAVPFRKKHRKIPIYLGAKSLKIP